MAIYKMNSQEFNNILSDTQDKIVKMNKNVSEIKDDMTTKVNVINHEINYLSNNIEKLNNSNPQDGNYVLLNKNNKGLYESYNSNVHAYFKKEPINIFNVKPINSDDIYYKDEAIVSINGVENDYYKNILKEDSVASKKIFFEEYAANVELKEDSEGTSYLDNENKINISIYLDKQKVYGLSKFNMIEIDPYLMRSFDIESISIYDNNDNEPTTVINDIVKVEKTRIILDTKYIFRKVDIIIKPKYTAIKNNEEIIPFGLKHIYFYEADFRNDSYMELEFNSENYIDYIYNKVTLYTPTGKVETTLKEQGIKIYLDKVNDVLTTEQEPTENIRKSISRNLKKIYFYIPIGQEKSTVSYTSTIYAIKFYIENR